ncbi:MAG: hypothetical protein F6K21_11355 [Symploca sp. SIO2D2]|nr:hypothetical protein [Symploca sp. SIO2D2]
MSEKKLRDRSIGGVSEKKGGELRKLRKLGEKRELIIFGHKAQEIPPKISFTRIEERISYQD